MDVINTGQALIRELNELSAQCHIKSEDHETFLWEAAIVEERIRALIEFCPPRENLRASVLLKNSRVSGYSPDLSDRLRSFYAECEKIRQG